MTRRQAEVLVEGRLLRQPMNDRLPRAARAAGSLAHDRQPVPQSVENLDDARARQAGGRGQALSALRCLTDQRRDEGRVALGHDDAKLSLSGMLAATFGAGA